MIYRPSFESSLLAGTTACVIAAAGLLARDAARQPVHRQMALRFQAVVGGLGLGPAADLSGCPYTLDPRLADRCSLESGSVPLGAVFCSHHGLSILPYAGKKGRGAS